MEYFAYWMVLAAALFPGALQHRQGGIVLSVRPEVIQIGDSATLTWSAPGLDSIYVSYIGYVSASGTRRIAPQRTTVFTALAEGPGGAASTTVRLSVLGARGGAEFPDRAAQFSYPLTARAQGRPLIALADHVAHVLQDDYSISVDEFEEPRQGRWVFITARRGRPDLVGTDEGSIGARRIAYRVVINIAPDAPREYQYRIETLLEYRRRVERTWHVEDNAAIAVREAQRLRLRIDAAR